MTFEGNEPVPPYCKACGSFPQGGTTCTGCGQLISRLRHPRPDETAIGYVGRKGILDRSNHVVVGESGATLTLFRMDGYTQELSRSDFRPDQRIAYREPRYLGCRLVGLVLDAAKGRLLPSWPIRRLWEATVASLPTVIEHREAALDLLAAGETRWLEDLALTPTELAWLQMRHTASRGDLELALAHMESLPPDTYPDKVLVILKFLQHIRGDYRLRRRALSQLSALAGLASAHLVTNILRAPEGEVEDDLAAWRALAQRLGFTYISEALAQVLDAYDLSRMDPEIERHGLMCQVLLGLLGRPTATSHRIRVADLERMPRRAIDGLVRAGALRHASPDGTPGSGAAYDALMKPWFAPESVTEAELQSGGGYEELARRHFVEGSPDLHRLDASLPPVRRYHLLDKLRIGEAAVTEELCTLLPPAQADRARVYGQFLREDAPLRHVASLLQDPSILEVSERLREQAMEEPAPFTSTQVDLGPFLLSRAIAETHAWQWDQALQWAKTCLASAQHEAIRDEALNVIAFAHLQNNQAEAALAALDEALRGDYTVDLIINAGIVAGHVSREQGGLHLARVAREAPSLALRAEAALAAVQLWGEDPEPWRDDLGAGGEDSSGQSTGLPEALGLLLREIVAEDIPLETFRKIAATLAHHDAEWVRAAGGFSATRHSGTREARVLGASVSGLEAFLPVLGAELRRQPEPWLEEERDRLLTIAHLLHDRDPGSGAGRFARLLLDSLPLSQASADPLLFIALSGLQEDLSTAGAAYNRLMEMVRTVPPRQLNRQAVAEAVRPIKALALEVQTELAKLASKIHEDVIHEGAEELRDGAQELLELSRRWLS